MSCNDGYCEIERKDTKQEGYPTKRDPQQHTSD